MKSRFEDENLKWIPLLILLVFFFPFILKSATFSYKYYLYVINLAGIYIILTVGLDILSGFTLPPLGSPNVSSYDGFRIARTLPR